MQQPTNTSPALPRPKVTVACVVEREGRFLVVEERSVDGKLVINQPAGHVEQGETLLEAAQREAIEETAWQFTPEFLVGIYLWAHPSGSVTYLRVCLGGTVAGHQPDQPLDEPIVQTHWLTRDELQARQSQLRSPLVLRVIDDYLQGERYPLAVLKSLLPTATQ